MASPQSVALLIKFRWLVDQLRDAEFNDFLSRFAKKQERKDILLTALFKLFSNRNESELNDGDSNRPETEHLIDMVGITQEIIRERRKETTLKKYNFSSLTWNCVGDIASYLEQEDYVRFSWCSRVTYRICNEFNTLRVLCLRETDQREREWGPDVHQVDLRRYPKLRCLKVDLCDILSADFPPSLYLSNQRVCKYLTKMVLDNSTDHDAEIGDCEELHWKLRPFGGITHLKMSQFGENIADQESVWQELLPFGTDKESSSLAESSKRDKSVHSDGESSSDNVNGKEQEDDTDHEDGKEQEDTKLETQIGCV